MKRDSFKAYTSYEGNNARERKKNKLIHDVYTMSKDSLSFKDVLVNDVARNVIIYHATMENKKYICSLPNESLDIGDIITYKDSKWIMLRAECDDEIYVNGYMERCNYKLRWQNEDGDIIKQDALIQTASQYNSGEFAIKTITIGYNQYLITIPLNENTLKIRSDDRFFIDINHEMPKPYRVTRTDTVSGSFYGVGVINLIVTEDQIKENSDNIELLICDYTEKINIINNINITCSNKPQIICGGNYKTFTSDTDNVTFSIDGTIDLSKITLNQTSSNKCKLKCSNDTSLIGSTIKLKCTNSVDSGEIYVDIVSGI